MRIMLRKLLWTGIFSALGAAAAMGAHRTAAGIWKLATGEEPPEKK